MFALYSDDTSFPGNIIRIRHQRDVYLHVVPVTTEHRSELRRSPAKSIEFSRIDWCRCHCHRVRKPTSHGRRSSIFSSQARKTGTVSVENFCLAKVRDRSVVIWTFLAQKIKSLSFFCEPFYNSQIIEPILLPKLNKEISVRCICVKLNIQNCESFKLFSSILWPTLVPNCLKLDITVLWIACFNWLRFERCCSICLNFMLEKIVNKIWSSHDLSYIIWNSIKMQVLIDIELRKIRITSIKTTDIGLQRIERDIKR